MTLCFDQGLLLLDEPLADLAGLDQQLRQFALREESYRHRFVQAHYGVAFDGYSWPGQSDSLNQGPEDPLHSFVFSDFSPLASYPRELQTYCRDHWPALTAQVQALERRVLQSLHLPALLAQFDQLFGHMMSANYYPATAGQQLTPLRLSAHPDVSLMTVFPFGLSPGFQYQGPDGRWLDAPETDAIAVFAGDLLQWLTDGAIPALHHRVRHAPHPQGERFSFALFSLPRPAAILQSLSGRRISSEDYYIEHLSQFDS